MEPSPAAAPDRSRHGSPLRSATVVAGGAGVALLLWLAGLIRFRSWRANDDIAVLQLGLERMGDGEIPLVGAYSRFGFFHPGPLREWTIGIGYHLSGGRAAAIPATALLINLGMVTLALVAAYRAYRVRGVVAAGVALTLAQIGMGTALHSSWNPHLAILAGAALGWGVVATLVDSGRSWWIAVVAGSVLGQLHVAGLALFAPALVVVAVILARTGDRRRLAIAAGTTIALWVGPVIDLFRGADSNLAAFLDRETGTAQGLSSFGAVIRLLTPWSLAGGDVTSAEVPGASILEIIVIGLLFLGATVVLVRHRQMAIAAVAWASILAAGLLGAMLVEPVFAYLWAPLVGATTLATSAVVLAAIDLVGDRWPRAADASSPTAPPSAIRTPAGAAAAAAIVVAVGASIVGWSSLAPIETASLQRTIEATIPNVVGDEPVRIRTGGNVLSLAHAEVALAVQQAGGEPESNIFELALPTPAPGRSSLVTAMADVLDCLAERLPPLTLVLRHPSQATGLDVGVFLVEPSDGPTLDECGVGP